MKLRTQIFLVALIAFVLVIVAGYLFDVLDRLERFRP